MIKNRRKRKSHFDLIRINSKTSLWNLHEIIPSKKLLNFCNSFNLREPYQEARKYGYKSTLIIVVPQKDFFNLLLKYRGALGYYRISCLEIARDTFYPTSKKAKSTLLKSRKKIHKKYTAKYSTEKTNDKHVEKHGGKIFRFVRYTRLSKINEKPCIHEEFRINTANYIKKKTDIKTIEDLANSDPKEIYRNLKRKYVTKDRIDTVKLGKWLENVTWRRKLSKSQLRKIKASALIFKYHNRILSFADLKNFFYEKKLSIKSKMGRRSEFEKKILEVKNYGAFKI